MAAALKNKIVSADEALAVVRDGDTVAFSGFVGIGTPRGTPKDIIEKLNREINLCLDDPKITAVLADTYRMPLKGSQEAFARFVSSEIEKSAKAIRAANIRAE